MWKGQKKRRCYSQKGKSANTQKPADPAASAEEIEEEPPNDATRGQARDSHSLAEMVNSALLSVYTQSELNIHLVLLCYRYIYQKLL